MLPCCEGLPYRNEGKLWRIVYLILGTRTLEDFTLAPALSPTDVSLLKL